MPLSPDIKGSTELKFKDFDQQSFFLYRQIGNLLEIPLSRLIEIRQSSVDIKPLTVNFGGQAQLTIEEELRTVYVNKAKDEIDLAKIFEALASGLSGRAGQWEQKYGSSQSTLRALEFYRNMAELVNIKIFGIDNEIMEVITEVVNATENLQQSELLNFGGQDELLNPNLDSQVKLKIKKRAVLLKTRRILEATGQTKLLTENFQHTKGIYDTEASSEERQKAEHKWWFYHIINPILKELEEVQGVESELKPGWQAVANGDHFSQATERQQKKVVGPGKRISSPRLIRRRPARGKVGPGQPRRK